MRNKRGHAQERLKEIISELRSAGADITYSVVAARYAQVVDAKRGVGCSPNTIYEAFKDMGVSYRAQSRQRKIATGPGNIFDPPNFGQISAQKFNCYYCKNWRVSIEDLSSGVEDVRLECRRMPPTADYGTTGRWPTVSPIEWCGEFQESLEAVGKVTVSYFGLLHFAGNIADDWSLDILANRLGAVLTNKLNVVGERIKEFSPTSLRIIRIGCDKLRAHGAIIPDAFIRTLDKSLNDKI